MNARAVAAVALAMSCAPALRPRTAAPLRSPTPVAEETAARAASARSFSEALVGDGGEARARSRALGITLTEASGARSITGDPERDDAVREARVLTVVGDLAAVLVSSRCGNAWLLSLRWDGAWHGAALRALIDDARPGACRVTTVRAEAAAVSTRAPREILVAWSSERDDGDSARETTFTAYRLDDGGRCVDLTGPVPLGGEDDATGAERAGSWFVDDVVPPPRDIVLEVRPSRPGPGGAGPALIERQVWRVEGARMVRVEAITESVVPRRAGAGFASPR